MDSMYALQYRMLYEQHWWWRSRERYVLDIISGLGLSSRSDILDIGCGDGLFFDALSKFGTPFGVEPDATVLSNSKWRDQIDNVAFDANFQSDRQFDLVLMLDVLEHLDDDVCALRCATKLLKPHGKILLTVPALMSAWTHHDDVNHHLRRYTYTSLSSLFPAAGLKHRFCRYYFAWTYFPKFVIRLKERLLGVPENNVQTQIPTAFVNTFLTYMSYFEHQVFHYIPLPFGTSLIALGERV